MTGSGHDLLVYGDSTARAAIAAAPVVVNDVSYPTGAAGVLAFPKEDCTIIGFGGVSEGIATFDEYRWHTTNDPTWNRTDFFKQDQTGAVPFDKVIGPAKYPFLKGDSLTVEMQDAAAQLDTVGMFINKGSPDAMVSGQPFGPLPPKTRWVSFTSAITNVADTWVAGAVVLIDYPLDRDKKYRVLGAWCQSATGHWFRFIPLQGEDRDNRPGSIMSDTETEHMQVTYWKPYAFEFSGLTGFNIETLASAADAAQIGCALIQEL